MNADETGACADISDGFGVEAGAGRAAIAPGATDEAGFGMAGAVPGAVVFGVAGAALV